jgi:hypothetical protein
LRSPCRTITGTSLPGAYSDQVMAEKQRGDAMIGVNSPSNKSSEIRPWRRTGQS